MNNGDLFDEGPRLFKCDGCGKYFEEPLLKQCRACGKRFCPDCRATHDCRETTSAPSSPVHINVQPSRPRTIQTPQNPKSAVARNPQKQRHTSLTFLDDDATSIGGADIIRDRAPRVHNTYRVQTIDTPEPRADNQQRSTHTDLLNNQEPRVGAQQHSMYNDALGSQDPLIPPLEKPLHQPTSVISQEETLGVSIDDPPVCAPDELICDNCGKPWKKMYLKKCRKCGAVLCPDCRDDHKCKKPQKKSLLKIPLHW